MLPSSLVRDDEQRVALDQPRAGHASLELEQPRHPIVLAGGDLGEALERCEILLGIDRCVRARDLSREPQPQFSEALLDLRGLQVREVRVPGLLLDLQEQLVRRDGVALGQSAWVVDGLLQQYVLRGDAHHLVQRLLPFPDVVQRGPFQRQVEAVIRELQPAGVHAAVGDIGQRVLAHAALDQARRVVDGRKLPAERGDLRREAAAAAADVQRLARG